MKTKVVNKNSFTQELSVTVPWKNLKEDYQKAFDKAKDHYTPPGGRKGKVFGVQLKLFKKITSKHRSSIFRKFCK